jgi:tRNA-2-methylthio-N6-dimethylallyladenosine synthase
MSRFVIVTFGCQMNEHDSERMAEVLCDAGHERVEHPSAADIVVVNTCSVREKAEQKLLSELGRLSRLKRARPSLAVVVAGCVAQEHGERLLARVPALDLVVGPDHIAELPSSRSEGPRRSAPGSIWTLLDSSALVRAEPELLRRRT